MNQPASIAAHRWGRAKFEQSVNEIKELTEKLREMNAPRKSFNSFNGCGTMLLDYRALADGTYEATRRGVLIGKRRALWQRHSHGHGA